MSGVSLRSVSMLSNSTYSTRHRGMVRPAFSSNRVLNRAIILAAVVQDVNYFTHPMPELSQPCELMALFLFINRIISHLAIDPANCVFSERSSFWTERG